jgi:predicted nucleotidyltransferase component of viral defense system
MKAFLLELIHQAADPAQAKNLVREYLQARILAALQQAGAMIPLAFHGGTALRFLFGIRRYSEDLDFALEKPNENYDLRAYLNKIRTDLTAETYNI